MTHRLIVAALLAALAWTANAQNKGSGSSSASSGAVLIDQARVEAGGVTPGDAPGFPLTLSQPGSYRLTSNLLVGDLATGAVLITSPDVTLDLSGFEIRGQNECLGAGAALNCTSMTLGANAPRPSGIAVQFAVPMSGSVALENGSVRGFAGHGVSNGTGPHHTFTAHRLRVSHNGWSGMQGAAAATDSVFDRNLGIGIYASRGVVRNVVSNNRGAGIHTSAVRHNDSYGNGSVDTNNYLFD